MDNYNSNRPSKLFAISYDTKNNSMHENIQDLEYINERTRPQVTLENSTHRGLDNSQQFFSVQLGPQIHKPTITSNKSRSVIQPSNIIQSQLPLVQESALNVSTNTLSNIDYRYSQNTNTCLLKCKQCHKPLSAVIQNYSQKDYSDNICLHCLEEKLYNQKQGDLQRKIAEQQKDYIKAWNMLKGTLYLNPEHECNCQSEPCICGCNAYNKNHLSDNKPEMFTNDIKVYHHKVYPNALSKKYVVIDEYKSVNAEIKSLLKEFPFLKDTYNNNQDTFAQQQPKLDISNSMKQDDAGYAKENQNINFDNIDVRQRKTVEPTFYDTFDQRFSQHWNKKIMMLQ